MTVAVFDNGAHIVSHLIQHFGTRNKPKYHIKEITVNKLEKESLLRHKKVLRPLRFLYFCMLALQTRVRLLFSIPKTMHL